MYNIYIFYNAAFHLTAGPGSNVGWRYLFLLVPFLLQTKDFVIIETTTKKIVTKKEIDIDKFSSVHNT